MEVVAFYKTYLKTNAHYFFFCNLVEYSKSTITAA